MEIILNGRCVATVEGKSIRNGDYDPDEFVLVGDHFQFRMTHDERLELLDTLKIADAAIREQEEHDASEDDEDFDLDATAADDQNLYDRKETARAILLHALTGVNMGGMMELSATPEGDQEVHRWATGLTRLAANLARLLHDELEK